MIKRRGRRRIKSRGCCGHHNFCHSLCRCIICAVKYCFNLSVTFVWYLTEMITNTVPCDSRVNLFIFSNNVWLHTINFRSIYSFQLLRISPPPLIFLDENRDIFLHVITECRQEGVTHDSKRVENTLKLRGMMCSTQSQQLWLPMSGLRHCLPSGFKRSFTMCICVIFLRQCSEHRFTMRIFLRWCFEHILTKTRPTVFIFEIYFIIRKKCRWSKIKYWEFWEKCNFAEKFA